MPALITKGLTTGSTITIGLGPSNSGPLYIVIAEPPDGIHVKVIFSEIVVASEALNPANYTINGVPSGSLAVLSVTQETLLTYVLTTAPQNVGQEYVITAHGIHDLLGNSI